VALRGATSVEENDAAAILEATEELVRVVMERNGLVSERMVSCLFTATEDLVSIFPAAAVRAAGLGDVPLLCARELGVTDATQRCIRVLMHVTSDRARSELRHVYLEGAQGLRDDLPG